MLLAREPIDVLGNSPTFAMSLGAKELFHTNFLAFLLGSTDPCLKDLQKAIRLAFGFPPPIDAEPYCAVWREASKQDLIIVELTKTKPSWSPVCELYPTGRVLIVEAKLKSIPSQDQLSSYDEKLSGGVVLRYPEGNDPPDWSVRIFGGPGLLLQHKEAGKRGWRPIPASSVVRCLLSVSGKSAGHWNGVSWDGLQCGMKSALPVAGALKDIVADYVGMLGALAELIGLTHRLGASARQSPSLSLGKMMEQLSAPDFQRLRIDDLLQKTLFHYWENAIPAIEAPSGWRPHRLVGLMRNGAILEVGFKRQQHLAGKDVTLQLGVQVQDGVFRLFVCVEEQPVHEFEEWCAARPGLWQHWFNFPVFGSRPLGGDGGPPEPPLKGNRTTLRAFDRDRFLYSYVPCAEKTVTEVENELRRAAGHLAEKIGAGLLA